MSAFPHQTREITPEGEEIVPIGTMAADEIYEFKAAVNRDTYGFLRIINGSSKDIKVRKPGDKTFTTIPIPSDLVDLPSPMYEAIQKLSGTDTNPEYISLVYHID